MSFTLEVSVNREEVGLQAELWGFPRCKNWVGNEENQLKKWRSNDE